MKKGLLSILASALLVVGCQNYDDQFNNLESQISALATTVAGLSQVQSDLSSLSGTVASLQSSLSGQIDTALADGLADIDAAIENTSGAATAAVDTSGSVTTAGSEILQMRMSDTTGAAINVSGFQKVTSAAVDPGFLTVELDISTPAPTIVEHGEFITANQATGTGLAIDGGDTGRVQFSNQDLSYTFSFAADGTNDVAYTIDGATKDFNAELSRVADEISAFCSGGDLIHEVTKDHLMTMA